jgi:hypothetical protein
MGVRKEDIVVTTKTVFLCVLSPDISVIPASSRFIALYNEDVVVFPAEDRALPGKSSSWFLSDYFIADL